MDDASDTIYETSPSEVVFFPKKEKKPSKALRFALLNFGNEAIVLIGTHPMRDIFMIFILTHPSMMRIRSPLSIMNSLYCEDGIFRFIAPCK